MKLLDRIRQSAPTVPETRESLTMKYGDQRRLLLPQFVRRNYPALSEDFAQIVVEAAEIAHRLLCNFDQYSRQRWLVDYLEKGIPLREIQQREPHFILPEEVLVEAENGKRAYVPPRFEKHENLKDVTSDHSWMCSIGDVEQDENDRKGKRHGRHGGHHH